MKKLLYILGSIWVLPVNLIVWVYLLILMRRGDIEEVTLQSNLALRWDVANGSKLYHLLRDRSTRWYGFVLGSNMIVYDDDPTETISEEYLVEKIAHENAHIIQNYILGVFYYPVYFICSIFIFCFLWDKHAYLDNPFERQARRKAGQRVDRPRESWPNGLNDRWNFW